MENIFKLIYRVRNDHYFRSASGGGTEETVFRVAHEVWDAGSVYDADGLSVLSLMLFKRGGGSWELGGQCGPIRPGLLLAYDRSDRLRLEIAKETEMRLFCLTRPAGVTLARQYALRAPDAFVVNNWREPWQLLRAALVCALSSAPHKLKVCNHYLRLWLSLIENDRAEQTAPENSAGGEQETQFIRRALELIEARLDRWRNLEELAGELRCSREHLCRLFARCIGRGPWEEIRERQLRLAEQILRGGGADIAEVAQRLGYSDRYSFAKAFKKHLGYPPGSCRRGAKRKP